MKMKFYLIVLSLLAVCLWGTGDVRAQSASRSMTVTGKVVDQNGAAVTGASVVVVGTTKGTTTGADGAFSLTGVASDARLAVNFIGYKTQTVEVGGRTSFNIVLVEEATAVDEVVVVGYGAVKRGDLTGSVASVLLEKRGISLGAAFQLGCSSWLRSCYSNCLPSSRTITLFGHINIKF